MALRKYECPFCHYRFRADADQMQKSGEVSVVRLATGDAEKPQERGVELKCPNCENEFEVTVEA